jgi:hypothetical protein
MPCLAICSSRAHCRLRLGRRRRACGFPFCGLTRADCKGFQVAAGDEQPDAGCMTDRNDLDGQLYRQFCAAKGPPQADARQAESREQLREMLAARQSKGIIFTTIQKFSLLEGERRRTRRSVHGPTWS